MQKYICKNSVRKPTIQFLMCSKLMKEGVDYTKKENALTAFCAHQKFCRCSGRTENTEEAKKCYQSIQK